MDSTTTILDSKMTRSYIYITTSYMMYNGDLHHCDAITYDLRSSH